MHRFFVPAAARTGRDVSLEREQAHQIARVLKLRVGEEIALVAPVTHTDAGATGGQASGQTGEGAVEWRVRLLAVEAKAVRGLVVAERAALAEPTCTVNLSAAILKGERFDWLIQKATELGVAVIRPLITTRTVRRTRADDTGAIERWRRIAAEAAEQSGRGAVPEILPPAPLRDMVASGRVLVAHEAVTGDAGTTLAAALPPDAAAVTLCIGPEGGFADEEVASLIERHGAAVVSLGPRVLRAETAAIAAVTLALAATGNLAPPAPRPWREIEEN